MSGKDHATATLNVIRAAMDLAERDEHLGLVTVEQIQSIARTRFAPADRKQLAALLKAEGKSNREIARELSVDEGTIRRDTAENSAKNAENSAPEANGKKLPDDSKASAKQGPNESTDAQAPANDSEGDEPDIENEVEPENYRTAFLIRADQARKLAVYSGPIDDEVCLMARQVAAVWTLLAQTLLGATK